MATRKRDAALDIIRAFAIVMVVLCHATERVYIVWSGVPGNALAGSAVYAALHLMSRLGVPLFLMLTGALVLRKRFSSSADVLRFYRTHLLPLFIATELWVVLYNLWFAADGAFSPDGLVKDLLFIEYPKIHFWYMPMILGLYATIPFVAMVVQHVRLRALALPLALVFALSSVWPTTGWFVGFLGLGALPATKLTVPFGGGVYGIYLILGYYAYNRRILREVPVALLAALGLVGVAGAFLFEYLTGSFFYENPFLPAYSLVCFEGFLRACGRVRSEGAFARASALLSVNAFGAYLIHMGILDGLGDATAMIAGKPLRVAAVLAVTLVASYAATALLGLIKPARRFLLNRR